jgi:hypothetical protein
MRRSNLTFDPWRWATLPGLMLSAGLLAVPARGQQPGQKTFPAPEEACQALVQAARNADGPGMLELFGPEGKTLVSSGDPAEDSASLATFVQRYEEMHRLVREPDGTTTLYIGAHNWPTPIPLVEKGQAWYFDTGAGKQEILFRRIGQNEISTILVCQELVAAQKEFHASHHGEYAQLLSSHEGQRDGLYWPAGPGEPESPLGPMVASAGAKGGGQGPDGSIPFRGYYFHILPRQGKGPGGFAFVSYPAIYRSTGVMTFVVNQDGVVRQKDLGPRTGAIAGAMKRYQPDSSWKKAIVEPTP